MNNAEILTQVWECADGCCLNSKTTLSIDGALVTDEEGLIMSFSSESDAMIKLASMFKVNLEIKEVWDGES